MMAEIFNQDGEKSGEVKLPSKIFNVEINKELVYQVLASEIANKRKPIAHTKNRGEVRGGGKKPWSQKGLGRARHGSIRSPIWKGGGTVFGPRKEKIFEKKIPKKMKRKALFMVLSEKLKRKLIIFLEDLKIEQPKTKLLVNLIEKWKSKIENFKEGTSLIVLPEPDKNLNLAIRNLPKTKSILAKNLNVLDALSFKYLILPKKSIEVIKDTFLK